MSDTSDIKTLLALGERTIAEVETLKERTAEDRAEHRRKIEKLREDTDALKTTVMKSQGNSEVWEERFAALSERTAACEAGHETAKTALANITTHQKVEKAKQRGFALGIGAAGAGVVEVLAKWAGW